MRFILHPMKLRRIFILEIKVAINQFLWLLLVRLAVLAALVLACCLDGPINISNFT